MTSILEALQQIDARSPSKRRPSRPTTGPIQPTAGVTAVATMEAEAPLDPSWAVSTLIGGVSADPYFEEIASLEETLARNDACWDRVEAMLDSAEEDRHIEPETAQTPTVEPTKIEVAPAEIKDEPADLPPEPVEAIWGETLSPGQTEPYDRLADNLLGQLASDTHFVLLFAGSTEDVDDPHALVNLAGALARRLGEDILLVDATWRPSRLAGHLETTDLPGLSDIVSGQAQWREGVQTTQWKNVHVMSPGHAEDWAGQMRNEARFASLLDDLRRQFRLVLLSVASPFQINIRQLATRSDGVFLTARLGRTTRDEARRARRAIETHGGRLFGCVVTADES